jgi:nucleoside-diphosphate-sugar epimerase
MPNMLIPELIVSGLLKKDFKATKGEQGREVNFVEDAVEGFVRAACSKKAVGEVINVGCGREYKIKEIIEKVLDLMGRPIEPLLGALPYRENEIWHMYCDNTKAKEILGWKPRHGLEQGLRKTIAWYREMYEKRPKAPYFRD